MRFIYLDEAGISNPKHEPYVVIAGVIVDADSQWKALETHLRCLADLHAPPSCRHRFVFHATELYSGGATFPRDTYSRNARWMILDTLIAIPTAFRLPVIFGSVDRFKLAATSPGDNPSKRTYVALGMAYVLAMHQAEYWMRTFAKGEVAAVVVENNHQAREMIESAHDFVQGRFLRDHHLEPLAAQSIIETPHFNEKRVTSPLQIADACAFAIKRHRMGKPDSNRFYDPLTSQFIEDFRTDL